MFHNFKVILGFIILVLFCGFIGFLIKGMLDEKTIQDLEVKVVQSEETINDFTKETEKIDSKKWDEENYKERARENNQNLYPTYSLPDFISWAEAEPILKKAKELGKNINTNWNGWLTERPEFKSASLEKKMEMVNLYLLTEDGSWSDMVGPTLYDLTKIINEEAKKSTPEQRAQIYNQQVEFLLGFTKEVMAQKNRFEQWVLEAKQAILNERKAQDDFKKEDLSKNWWDLKDNYPVSWEIVMNTQEKFQWRNSPHSFGEAVMTKEQLVVAIKVLEAAKKVSWVQMTQKQFLEESKKIFKEL